MAGTKTTTFRSDARRPAGASLGLALAFLAGSSTLAAGRGVAPLEPADGTISGGNPVFVLAYSGIDEADLRDARFRIELSTDGFRTPAETFDQRERPHGWVPGEPGTIIFRPSRPLPDGDYEWRASAWNGLAWVGDAKRFRLRVDTVPPAPVDDLRARLGDDGVSLVLEWRPVVLDVRGDPEYVARYLVYRYTRPGPYPIAPAREVGEAPGPAWTDREPPAEPPLVLYRVDAEDAAGNSASRR